MSIGIYRLTARLLLTVVGHAGKLIFGTMGHQKVPVVLLVGRAQSVDTTLVDSPIPPFKPSS